MFLYHLLHTRIHWKEGMRSMNLNRVLNYCMLFALYNYHTVIWNQPALFYPSISDPILWPWHHRRKSRISFPKYTLFLNSFFWTPKGQVFTDNYYTKYRWRYCFQINSQINFLPILHTTLAIQNYHSCSPDTCLNAFGFKKR